MNDLKVFGKRVLLSIEDRESIGRGGVILSAIKDDLLKGKVLDSGIHEIKKGDRVFFKKFGGIKFEDQIIVEEKDILVVLNVGEK